MGEQINKVYGRSTMALHLGTKPEHVPSMDAVGGTPNHKAERAALLLGFHKAPDPLAGESIKRCVDVLRSQLQNGHGCIGDADELLTDSHAPIWYRAMLSMLITAHQMAFENSEYRALYRLVRDWWAYECWLCDQLLVPRGPLKGKVVGLGARHRTGWDLTRDVCQAVIRDEGAQGEDYGQPRKWWDNTKKYQDTFAAHLALKAARKGAFRNLPRKRPHTKEPYVITHTGWGHQTECDFGPRNPKLLKVRYDDGCIETA